MAKEKHILTPEQVKFIEENHELLAPKTIAQKLYLSNYVVLSYMMENNITPKMKELRAKNYVWIKPSKKPVPEGMFDADKNKNWLL